MSIIRSTKSDKISINNQHDYMTLRFPAGTFTMSYNGTRSKGLTRQEHDSLTQYMETVVTGKTNGDKFQSLLDPEILTKYVPNWEKPDKVPVSEMPKVKVGQMAKIDTEKIDSKSHVQQLKTQYAVHDEIAGKVSSVTSRYVVLDINKNDKLTRVRFPREWIVVI